jgi:origin recognition complex subunit 4
MSGRPRVLDLSVLELIFLVAMKRLEDRNISSYNFEAVFAEYDRFVKDVAPGFKYSKGVGRKSFDILLAAELIAIADKTRHAGGAGEHRWHLPVQLLIAPNLVKVYVRAHPLCSMVIRQWIDDARA